MQAQGGRCRGRSARLRWARRIPRVRPVSSQVCSPPLPSATAAPRRTTWVSHACADCVAEECGVGEWGAWSPGGLHTGAPPSLPHEWRVDRVDWLRCQTRASRSARGPESCWTPRPADGRLCCCRPAGQPPPPPPARPALPRPGRPRLAGIQGGGGGGQLHRDVTREREPGAAGAAR